MSQVSKNIMGKLFKLSEFDSYGNKENYRTAFLDMDKTENGKIMYYGIFRNNFQYYITSNFEGGCSMSKTLNGPFDLDNIIDFLKEKQFEDVNFNYPQRLYSQLEVWSNLYNPDYPVHGLCK